MCELHGGVLIYRSLFFGINRISESAATLPPPFAKFLKNTEHPRAALLLNRSLSGNFRFPCLKPYDGHLEVRVFFSERGTALPVKDATERGGFQESPRESGWAERKSPRSPRPKAMETNPESGPRTDKGTKYPTPPP